jgi:hypothetical protein
VNKLFWKNTYNVVGEASQWLPLPSVNFAILGIVVNLKIDSFIEFIQYFVDEFSLEEK